MNSAKLSITNSAIFWLILALIAFVILPSKALDYGLLESFSPTNFTKQWAGHQLTLAGYGSAHY